MFEHYCSFDKSSGFDFTGRHYQKRQERWIIEDPSGYLSHGLVGKDTSREAAAIFYSANTFVMKDIEVLPIFLKHDCYGFGLLPSTHVQELVLVLDNTPPFIWRSRSTAPPENVEYTEGPDFCISESESEETIK